MGGVFLAGYRLRVTSGRVRERGCSLVKQLEIKEILKILGKKLQIKSKQ